MPAGTHSKAECPACGREIAYKSKYSVQIREHQPPKGKPLNERGTCPGSSRKIYAHMRRREHT